MTSEDLQRLEALIPDSLARHRRDLLEVVDAVRNGRADARRVGRAMATAERSAAAVRKRAANLPKVSYPADLPVSMRCEEIVTAIRENQVVVIAGETGSGKTTQIPKMCLDAGRGLRGKIGCTQPRRVAAQSIARRVAQELEVQPGREVGSKVRFSDETARDTYIKFMTDGILLAEIQSDPWLEDYDTIIIDEAHERSLNIDFILGCLIQLTQRRSDLKVIITSATIDTNAFSEAFGGAPIIEVSGRLYPVEVLYMPVDHAIEDTGDVTYVDAAVSAVETVIDDPISGDVLVFMPGERDIRETRDLLEGRRLGVEIVPLFGRLSSAEQQRIFQPGAIRRVIIATNIAETSITIPNIRYVVDAGLARISRYSPGTRTKRLPIEPVSKSSSNQRKGRCGRVANGVCIRLYSEEEFAERSAFTPPEIQRCNLAEVILRMKAFKLGEIETFPFISPPKPHAMRGGYALLHELGALDEKRELTPLGRELARLPIDPIVGRMILEAREENALREVSVIAAGLSIQDPRERPTDAAAAADAMHKRFLDERSDFLTLLNIWNAYHDEWERLKTQSQMRKFCRSHFVSYLRMREWADLHRQIREVLKEGNGFQENMTPADYDAIHRSILSGLLTQIGIRKDPNVYTGCGNRRLMVFPGSVLFDRNARKANRKGKAAKSTPEPKTHQPRWLMAGEIVETSRLFARTVAGIQPDWIAKLGGHLCKHAYFEPHWSVKSQRVLVTESITLGGLELIRRRIDYGRIDAAEATDIFIRAALIEGDADVPHRFFEHNRQLLEKLQNALTRSRNHGAFQLEQGLYEFYAKRLAAVSSIHDLNRVVRDRAAKEPDFLCATEDNLLRGQELSLDVDSFPEEVTIRGERIRIDYAYAPGEEHDGATIRLSPAQAQTLSEAELQWTIPGYREQLVAALFKSLPKARRRELMPITEKTRLILNEFKPGGESMIEGMSRIVQAAFGVEIGTDEWDRAALPRYILPRFVIVDAKGKELGDGTELAPMIRQFVEDRKRSTGADFVRSVGAWEKPDVTSWSFDDLPEKVEVGAGGDVSMFGWPGLEAATNDRVNLRIYQSPEDAEQATSRGFELLCARVMDKDMAWLQRDLRSLARVKPLYVTLGSFDELLEASFRCLRSHLFECAKPFPLSRTVFEKSLEQANERQRGIVPVFVDRVDELLKLRQSLMIAKRPYPGLEKELAALLPAAFPDVVPFGQLQHLPRYLKSMSIRCERHALNPSKDAQRAAEVQPFADLLASWGDLAHASDPLSRKRRQFRWMVEEFKVSLFSQELGTAHPVSAKRLKKFLETLK